MQTQENQTKTPLVRELRKCFIYLDGEQGKEFITDALKLNDREYIINDHGKYVIGAPTDLVAYLLENEYEFLDGLSVFGAKARELIERIKKALSGLGDDRINVVCENEE